MVNKMHFISLLYLLMFFSFGSYSADVKPHMIKLVEKYFREQDGHRLEVKYDGGNYYFSFTSEKEQNAVKDSLKKQFNIKCAKTKNQSTKPMAIVNLGDFETIYRGTQAFYVWWFFCSVKNIGDSFQWLKDGTYFFEFGSRNKAQTFLNFVLTSYPTIYRKDVITKPSSVGYVTEENGHEKVDYHTHGIALTREDIIKIWSATPSLISMIL